MYYVVRWAYCLFPYVTDDNHVIHGQYVNFDEEQLVFYQYDERDVWRVWPSHYDIDMFKPNADKIFKKVKELYVSVSDLPSYFNGMCKLCKFSPLLTMQYILLTHTNHRRYTKHMNVKHVCSP